MGQTMQPSMDYDLVINQAKTYVERYFEGNITEAYQYHSLEHTLEVTRLVQELGRSEGVSDEDIHLLTLAALFHDIGYKDGAQGHEMRGAEMARAYLTELAMDESDITQIEELIQATKMGSEPKNLLGEIMCDADLSHIGTKRFSKRSKALREEKEQIEGLQFSDREWLENNIQFLEMVEFHTQSARDRFSARKKKNVAKLKENLVDMDKPESVLEMEKLYKDIDGKKGVQTMFRTTLRNHNQLSKIADNKASIMLSISAIMLSIVVSTLAPKLDSNPHLKIPATMVLVACMLTIIFSILSARPQISTNRFSVEKFNSNRFNILFFGNFASMNLEEFEWAMKELMREPDKLYSSLSQDLFFLGKVLVKKYKLLNIAYTIFMIGMIASAIAFVIAFILYDPNNPGLLQQGILNNQ